MELLSSGYNVTCLVPRIWMEGARSNRADAIVISRRNELWKLIHEEQLAEFAPEGLNGRELPPLVHCAIARRAILVTNSKFADAISCYRAPAQQEAMKGWLRTWVWPLTSRDGRLVPEIASRLHADCLPHQVWPFTFRDGRFVPQLSFVPPSLTLSPPHATPTTALHEQLEQEIGPAVEDLLSAASQEAVYAP
jgi:hypothetical protein